MTKRLALIVQAVLVTFQIINAGLAWPHQGVVGVIISGIQGGMAFYVHGLDEQGNKL